MRCLECECWEWCGEVRSDTPQGFALRFGLGAFLGGKERVLTLNAIERLWTSKGRGRFVCVPSDSLAMRTIVSFTFAIGGQKTE
jgi:hypothetical protein